jgi:hypothetical protein
MSRGFIYYCWFPWIRVFKVGRTIQGLGRFHNRDYKKFYEVHNNYMMYSWSHLVMMDNHKEVEKQLHSIYRTCEFENIGKKREFYYAPDTCHYHLSKSIFYDVTEYYKNIKAVKGVDK